MPSAGYLQPLSQKVLDLSSTVLVQTNLVQTNQSLASEVKVSSSKSKVPSSEGETSSLEGETSSSEGETSSSEGETSSSEVGVLSSEGEAFGSRGEAASVEPKASGLEGEVSSLEGKALGLEGDRSCHNTVYPGSNHKPPQKAKRSVKICCNHQGSVVERFAPTRHVPSRTILNPVEQRLLAVEIAYSAGKLRLRPTQAYCPGQPDVERLQKCYRQPLCF